MWPNARNVHHTRGALKHPLRSYTTTSDSFAMSSASAAAPKAAGEGSMCGRSVSGAEILSRSKKREPGMRLPRNSSYGSLPVPR